MAAKDQTNNLLSKENVKDAAMFGAEFIPGVGEALAIKRTSDALDKKDYIGAGIEATAGLLGIIPGVGDLAGKGLRVATKGLRKADIDEANKLIKDDAAAETWKETNKLPESQRQKRVPEVQKAAIDLSEGKITSQEYRRAVTANQPIQSITKDNFPDMPTKTEIVGALKATDPRKVDTGIVGLNKTIPDGTRVGSRLDIPSYDGYDKWIVSLHDGTKKGGKAIGYGQTAVLKDVEFMSSAKGGLNIAKGKTKSTIARIHGDYINAEPENVFEAAKKLIDDPEWTQVGMNPFRHSYFYNKATGAPVTRADEVIQVGPLVLAKGVKKPTISELKELKIKTKDNKIRVFNEGGAVSMKEQMAQPTPRPSIEQTKTILADRSAARSEEHEQNRQDIIAHLKKRGLRPEAIAAIVGNIAVETGGSFKFDQMQTRSGDPYDPNTVRFGGYGLFQFDDYSPGQGHRSWYQEYLKDNEKTDSLESQLDYVLDTIFADTQDTNYKYTERLGISDAGTLKAYLETNTNPEQISDAFVDRFEKAGVPHSSRRRDEAMKTFAELSPPDGVEKSPEDQFIDQPGEIKDTGEGPDMDTRSTYDKIKPYIPILRHFDEGGMSTKFYPDIMHNYPITKEMIEALEKMTEEERLKLIADAIARQQEGERRTEPLSEDAIERLKGLRRNYNEGGIAKQMELFEDGGLNDEGGTTDPVSGNDVPPGSTQEEVRDDIPAQLSEGEFVFPADVVRYIGLEKLMQMRQEAKMGLKMMEEMGQMGNSDEAIMPDDIPFDLSDLDMEDDLEYNVGGSVPPQQTTASTGYVPYTAPEIPKTMYTPPKQQSVPMQQPSQTARTKEDVFPKLPTDPTVTTEEYINSETGERRTFTFVGGKPTVEIPAGFIPVADYKPKEVTSPPVVGEAQVRDDDDKPDEATGATIAFGGSLNSRGRVDGAYLGNISYEGLGFGDARSRAMAGATQFFSEDNITPPLPEGATAILSNLKLPKNPGDIRPAEVMRARLQVDSDFFNKTIANTNVTDRRDLEKTVDYIRNKYKSNFLNDSDNIINVEQEFRQMQRDESDASARKQLAEARRKQERGDDSGFDRIVEAAVKQATKEVERDYDDEAASSVSVSEAELEAARQSAPTLSQAEKSDDFYEEYDFDFQQGGLAVKKKPKAKKMKRGGLASKK